jgi:hypothetical protein
LRGSLAAACRSHCQPVHYLNRHIELDSQDHGPLARRLLDNLCGNDPRRQREATQTACSAIQSRIRLWDGLLAICGIAHQPQLFDL